jgi:hypothetical protein
MRPLDTPKPRYVQKNSLSKNGKRLGRPPDTKNSRKVNKRKPGTAPPKQPAKRTAGPPPSGKRPLSPEVSKRVASAWLRGESLTAIAEQTGTHRSALARHIDAHILPVFRSELAGEALRITGLLKEAARVAWLRVLEDRSDSDSLKLFCWACDNMLSISGAHAPLKLDVQQQYRVAGQPPAQLEASMLDRLARRIEDLRHSAVSTVDAVSHETLEERAQVARSQPPVM